MEKEIQAGKIGIPEEFFFVIIDVILAAILQIVLSFRCSYMRTKHKVDPPTQHDEYKPEFNRAIRIYMNTVEALPTYYAVLIVAGLEYPYYSFGFGLAWIIMRIMWVRKCSFLSSVTNMAFYRYAIGYSFGAKYRVVGFLGSLVCLICLIGVAMATLIKQIIAFS